MLCLILLSFGSFSQSILINSFQVKSVLKDRAELEMRRKDAVIDSIANFNLLQAYNYKDSALQQSTKALKEADRIGQDWHGLKVISDDNLKVAKKEARKQRFLKWVGFGGMALIAVLAASR